MNLVYHLYKKTFSPLFTYLFGYGCMYRPTCSQYMLDAVVKYGLFKGAWMGIKRFSRCHPWADASYDPVS